MNKFFKSFLLIFIFIFSFGAANGADIAKIGVVDFQRILKESDAGKSVARRLREKQDERTAALKEKRTEIVGLQKIIENMGLLSGKEEREEKKIELNIKLDSFKEMEIRYSQELKEINFKYSDKIKKEVNRIVIGVGKKGGYLLIVEKEDVLYSPDAIDITTKVIQQYNKDYDGKW